MMKSLRNQTHKIAISLAWLFICLSPSPNVVLCIGADGHIEIEAADERQCTSLLPTTKPKTSSAPPMYEVISTNDHCGPCFDLRILTSSSEEQYLPSARRIESQVDGPMMTTSWVSQPVDPTITSENSPSYSPPLFNPTLIVLRTVTLLI